MSEANMPPVYSEAVTGGPPSPILTCDKETHLPEPTPTTPYTCENSCLNGACSPCTYPCTDDDPNDDAFVFGTMKVGEAVKEDECNGNLLTQYYCKTQAVSEKAPVVQCPNGCQNGVCLI